MLRLEKVSKYFGGLAALSGISVEICEGEFVGLIGPNGSGKTTLFNVISGVLKPNKGKIFYYSRDITGLTPDRICHLGIVRTFQIPRPFRDMTVLENVMIGALFGKKSADSDEGKAKQLALECLSFVGLEVTEKTMPDELTAVGLRRLELAKALATKPKVLLADEVLSGLNKEELEQAARILKKIHAELGVTIIWVEHIMGALMNLVDRVIVLDYGELIADGSPREIANNERVIEAYLGEE
ncbi:MAG: ABC transporter ATP-binding protein [Deltaproteobacteria bacterium]|nr:MAG: ABC transporter ATP-binding protein [Deltaproteobacteria bacterium]